MSIASEIERIKANIANAYAVCEGKGATMPSVLNSANLAECIGSITGAEPSVNYIDGATAIWTGENRLNESNQWVDEINGYTFTPISSSAVPVYNAYSKLIDINTYGGMVSSLLLPATTETQYTLELVLRDMDESSGNGGVWGRILGSEMSNWTNKNKTYSINGAWNASNQGTGRENSYNLNYYNGGDANHYSITQRQHGITTIAVIPTQGMWINGVKEAVCSLDCVSTQFAIGGSVGSNAYASQTKVKVHSVRFYPMILTTEQLVHNYNIDISKFGE